jgi:hypothetical protein
MVSKVLVFCALAAVASAFAPARGVARQVSSSSISMVQSKRQGSIFDKAVKDWAAEYPAIYNVGWGPTVKAERWNGKQDNRISFSYV